VRDSFDDYECLLLYSSSRQLSFFAELFFPGSSAPRERVAEVGRVRRWVLACRTYRGLAPYAFGSGAAPASTEHIPAVAPRPRAQPVNQPIQRPRPVDRSIGYRPIESDAKPDAGEAVERSARSAAHGPDRLRQGRASSPCTRRTPPAAGLPALDPALWEAGPRTIVRARHAPKATRPRRGGQGRSSMGRCILAHPGAVWWGRACVTGSTHGHQHQDRPDGTATPSSTGATGSTSCTSTPAVRSTCD
jgi:hypothetical protein